MIAETHEVEPSVIFSYYYRKGTPVTLVFIHGLGDWKETHLKAAEYPELSKYGMLMIDQIGYGDSSHPDGFSYTMKAQAEALKKLIEQLDIGDVVLIPHSMGGPVAVDLAELLGSKVKGIIYAEGNVDFNDCFFSNWIITEHSYDQWVNETFPSLLARYKQGPSQAKYTVSFGKAGGVSTYKSSGDLVAVSKKDDVKDRLVALNVPVLTVFGEKNRGKFTSEAKMGEAFPLVFISDAAHSMMLDNPDAYYREVSLFLGKILK